MFGFLLIAMNLFVRSNFLYSGVFSVSSSVIVCDGCCCGRVEKGHNKVPINDIVQLWNESELGDNVKLTISGCLGPCSMHNVSLLKTEKEQIWLGKLSEKEHYEALVEWAIEVSQSSDEVELPEVLLPHRFVRNIV